ncbi:MAG: polysaccharide biosynthesis tyrosine autokinase [Coleofasciculus sp. A1-SPW-01]|uniref:GumC family protein n=1 Tax=Coleofasciculus sp. A1-SPW-01 TaxID=3070819 RepID=UPI0032FC3538
MEIGQIQPPLSPNGNGKHPQYAPPMVYRTPPPEPEPDEWTLRQLVNVIRRRALVIAGVAIAVTSGISFWTLNQTPKYESKFQLLVEPVTEEGDLDKLTEAVGGGDGRNSTLDYDTQIQVLRSPQLMEAIVQEIHKHYPEVSYESLMTQLIVSRLGDTKILEGRYRDTEPERVRRVLHEVARGYLRYSLQERQLNLKQGIQFVDDQLPVLRDRVNKLQGQLQAFRQQHNLLDPEIQAQELSQRVSAIEQQQLQTQVQYQETRSLYNTLLQQLGLSPQQAVATVTLSEAPRYQQLLNQLAELESQIALESARFTPQSPTMQALRQKRDNLLPLLNQESQNVLGASLTEAGVSSASPNSIRTNLTQQLVQATNQLQVLQVKQSAIARSAQMLNLQVKQIPVIARRYTDLQRELQVATDSLNRFLAVRENLEIEAAQKALPWQIILKPEVPQVPVWPNTQRNITLGAIAGLLLGMGVALLIERLDNVFHSPDELKDLTKLPLLGIIPYQKQLKQQMMSTANLTQMTSSSPSTNGRKSRHSSRSYNASPFLESFRSLQTNIRFLGSDTPVHSIIISSATPSEGKSTVSVHLAQAAAAMGQRVLLVDADLRRPQVHHYLNLDNQVGLSNVIATGLTAKQAIQRLPMWDRLYVLTAGQVPPDPSRLLCSKKMQHLMEQFHAVFDLVIYDTPPVLGLADGRLLAAHADGVMMVVGLGKSDRSALMQALDSMRISNATVLGVVANGVKGYTTRSYYYYHNHYATGTESDILKAKQLLMKRMEENIQPDDEQKNHE